MSDRKYRQSGYQDSGHSERRDRPKRTGGRPDPTLKPRGRGLGKPTDTVFRCAMCGHKEVVAELTQASTCGKCGTDLHTCTHCKAFDTSAPGECRKDAEYVASKAKGNSCGDFEPRLTREFAAESPDTPSDAKAAFDSLFNF